MRAFRHRDFVFLWFGAFFSFTGSWIQNIAQGWLVYELTGDKSLLAWVSFCNSVPISIFGPFAGTIADMLNKRAVLIVCQFTFSLCALYLALAAYLDFLTYHQILVVAVITGLCSAIEMPTRQSLVSRIVPPEDLPAAIPLQAMTFNSSRFIGPAIGAFILERGGPAICYGINGLSYLAMITFILAISANLEVGKRAPQPIKDLILEGFHYTLRDRRLRTLFIMEGVVAGLGMFYLAQMPAIAKTTLGLDESGLGRCWTMVGIGAIVTLSLLMILEEKLNRALLVRVAMTIMGLCLIGMSFAKTTEVAYPLFILLGACTILQFNITNTLFQVISPERLRGRTLSMHMWALSGVGPIGTIAFGYVAQLHSLALAFQLASGVVLCCAIWAWTRNRVFREIYASMPPKVRA